MGITKIINDRTTYVQGDGQVFGVFLDITVYDRVPINFLKHIDMFLVKRSFTVLRGKLPGNGIKNRLRNVFIDVLFPNKRSYFLFFQKIVELLGHTSRYTYSELFGSWAQTIPYRASVFENYSTIEFEGKQYMIVRDYIEYLTTRYNRTDFREPEEKQVAPHIILFNPNLPYKDYLNNSECNDGI